MGPIHQNDSVIAVLPRRQPFADGDTGFNSDLRRGIHGHGFENLLDQAVTVRLAVAFGHGGIGGVGVLCPDVVTHCFVLLGYIVI